MRFVVVTIFPEFFQSPLSVGLLGKAIEAGLLSVDTLNPRAFTTDRHQTVDDTPFGGGPGMVMKIEPLVDALESPICSSSSKRVLLSPRGRRFSHAVAQEFLSARDVTLVCGRYEGVDERLVEGGFVTEELSVGDFVLNGGETAALAVIECCSRLLPGAMGNELSPQEESFAAGLLDFPHYTKPREFRGMAVPDVLLSGNHKAVAVWRRKRALELTLARRPDLFQKLLLDPADRSLLENG